ncbi:MAG TPA: hypothetical protein VLF71_04135 [Candidatus Saccharimonadales bacterium]|nr:hypothetical protein [Candidatus Saccharimonadales bacterium]
MSGPLAPAGKRYAPYFLLALIVLAPLFAPGYILTLDAVFVPRIAAPAAVGSDYLWQWALHALNSFVPAQALEKAIFVAIVLVSAIGAHRLVERLRQQVASEKTLQWGWVQYAGGVLYAANPFTYDRFMAGQYGVLMGYALLPSALMWVLDFAARPGRNAMLKVACAMAVLGIVSLPTLGEFVLLAACVMLASAWQKRRQAPVLWAYVWRSFVALGLFALLSCYWLAPLLSGKGATATAITGFTPAHTAAFATVGDTLLARIAAVLRLQGFWAEAHYLYELPQQQLPGWGTVRLVVWALVALGLAVLWLRERWMAAWLTAALILATVLAAGLFGAQLTDVGYREPQKFAGVVALVFAVCAAFGAARLQSWAVRQRAAVWQAAVPALVALAVLLFTPTMYWGFAGQLTPREYPAAWFQANAYLNRQRGGFQSVFLPWHQYMGFGFAGRIIATPAAKFFQQPVITSNDPELGAIQPPAGKETTQIGKLVLPGRPHDMLAGQLAAHNVRYILLAKDYDFQQYAFLSSAAHIRRVFDSHSIAVYENLSWKGVPHAR